LRVVFDGSGSGYVEELAFGNKSVDVGATLLILRCLMDIDGEV